MMSRCKMKSINLVSLLNVYHNVTRAEFYKFKKYYGIDLKDHEITCIESLIRKISSSQVTLYENFYASLTIPHIGKEFDLIRFGKDYLVNIELKIHASQSRILAQLRKNKYYLNYLKGDKYYFCYMQKNNTLYQLTEENKLRKVSHKILLLLLNNQQQKSISHIENLFDPVNYLVSPFNATQKFLASNYLLTSHQSYISKKILTCIFQQTENYFSITGGPGTGKTLLIYHIARELIKHHKRVLIVHSGTLNAGQIELNRHQFIIIDSNSFTKINLSQFDIIIIDEAQHLRKTPYKTELSFEEIINRIKEASLPCIISYDENQTIAYWESGKDINIKIKQLPQCLNYHLTNYVRTNGNIIRFINAFLDKNYHFTVSEKDNIDFIYCHSEDAIQYFSYLKNNWKIIQYYQSKRDNHLPFNHFNFISSKEVFGQEFDNVAVFVDKNFTYNKNGRLECQEQDDYCKVRMLYQNITRVRKKLKIIIIENKEILARCLSLLDK